MLDKITILISTTSGRLSGVKNVIKSIKYDSPNIIIIIQEISPLDNNEIDIINNFNSTKNIKAIVSSTSGVTKSRNIALSYVKTDYAIFSDDDISYCSDFLNVVVDSFEKYPDAAFLTFNVVDENNLFLKNYPLKVLKHNKFSILKVGTIEIAINNKASSNILFPEDMGAGNYLFCCDEPVYLGKFIHRGLIGYHLPKVICSHPRLSSGKKLNSKAALLSRLTCFKRIFGSFIGIPVFILFFLKNIRKII